MPFDRHRLEAFGHVGLDWRKHVEIDPRYYRPAEVDLLIGDASKAKVRLGWTPTATLEDLVREMMDSDLALMAPGRSGA